MKFEAQDYENQCYVPSVTVAPEDLYMWASADLPVKWPFQMGASRRSGIRGGGLR